MVPGAIIIRSSCVGVWRDEDNSEDDARQARARERREDESAYQIVFFHAKSSRPCSPDIVVFVIIFYSVVLYTTSLVYANCVCCQREKPFVTCMFSTAFTGQLESHVCCTTLEDTREALQAHYPGGKISPLLAVRATLHLNRD